MNFRKLDKNGIKGFYFDGFSLILHFQSLNYL